MAAALAIALATALAPPDFNGGRVTVHFGHQTIHEDQVVRAFFKKSQSLQTVPGQIHLATQASESVLGDLAIHSVVFDDQHHRRLRKANGPTPQRQRGRSGFPGDGKGKRKPESRPYPFLAAHPDLAAHGFDE